MIDENPYSPPKSEDFRLPKSAYQPSKKQRMARVIIGISILSLLLALFNYISYLIEILITGKKIELIRFLISIGTFVISIIPSLFFSIFTEYHIEKIKNKKYYVLFWAFSIIIFSWIIIVLIGLVYYNDRLLSLSDYLGYLIGFVKGIHNNVSLSDFLYSIILYIIAVWITLVVLNKHRQYYKKKNFRQPETF